MEINAERMIFEGSDDYSIANLIKGKNLNNAIMILSDNELYESEPIIIIKPSFWPWIPLSPQRIKITVGY